MPAGPSTSIILARTVPRLATCGSKPSVHPLSPVWRPVLFELKLLSKEGIPGALEKAIRYRSLGQPREAESIYLDILQAEPTDRQALVGLLLALTDQFDRHPNGIFARAHELLPRLDNEYDRAYYAGIIHERRAHAALHLAGPGRVKMAYDLLRQAMDAYEKAEPLRRPGDDDSLLRWNACARLLMRLPLPESGTDEPTEPYTDA